MFNDVDRLVDGMRRTADAVGGPIGAIIRAHANDVAAAQTVADIRAIARALADDVMRAVETFDRPDV